MAQATITAFEDLTVWQESQSLAVLVYQVTKKLPREEAFGITNQIRRAASSVSANIAEGFGRTSPKDKIHFYTIAYGSLLETKNFIYLTRKLGYLTDDAFAPLIEKCILCQKFINAFKKGIE